MKSFLSTKLYIALFSLLAVSLTYSCHKDPKTPATATGTLQFHLHTDVDTTEVESLGEVYRLANGRQISVSFAQLYLTHIQLIKSDGTPYEVPGLIILKRQENEVYTVGNVPVGNYKSVSFHVGLDAASNQYAPTKDSVLNHPDMWFDSLGGTGWGYRFINFAGRIDVTPNGNGPIYQMQPFELRLGGPDAYQAINMPEQDFTVAPGQLQVVHMTVNYAYLFNGIDVTNPANLSIQNPGENTGTQLQMDKNITTAQTATSNITTAMFTYEYE